MSYNQEVTNYIASAPAEQTDLLNALRTLIHESVGEVSETIKWGFPVFATTKDFNYLKSTKKHVTLGFYHADKIDDPNNILEGTGKTMRHVKIKQLSDINEPLFKKWLQEIAE